MEFFTVLLARNWLGDSFMKLPPNPAPALSQLQFYATAAYPCSYLEHRTARSQVAAPAECVNTEMYNALVQHGFRRSGPFIYRPHCDQCHACQSIRINVQNFEANRSQRRAWSRHAELVPTMIAPGFYEEHYALYTRYQKARHEGGGMDLDDVAQYDDFLVKTNVNTLMVEFRLPSPDIVDSELKMVSIIDQLDDGLSAVYTFFSPEPRQNYGTFNVLWQIRLAQTRGLPHLYLGYWIEQCRKMSYKTRFRPFELFAHGKWTST